MIEGTDFGDYRVIARLGQGGMGAVYLVENTRLGRREALKVITPTASPDFQIRFDQEARTAASLDHPGIIGIHHYGVTDDTPWFTMTYLDGRELTAAQLSVDETLNACARIASALDYAHGRGVVHRDIKPANIIVTRTADGAIDRVVVLDFGIAKLADATGITATGAFIGTLLYAAPEMLHGRPPTPRSDQYSLACTAFEVFCGSPPFTGPTPVAVMSAHNVAPVPSIGDWNPALRALDPVFARALAKDPDHRFASCSEFAAALAAALRTPPTVVPRPPVPTPIPVPAPTPRPLPPPVTDHHPNRGPIVAAVVAIVAVVGVLLAVGGVFGGDSADESTTPLATATSSQASSPETSATDTTVATTPAISACVLNAGAVTGLGSRTADVLRAAGLDVSFSGNVSTSSIAENTVFYPEGREADARTVAAAVPGGASIEPRPTTFPKCPGEIAVLVVN